MAGDSVQGAIGHAVDMAKAHPVIAGGGALILLFLMLGGRKSPALAPGQLSDPVKLALLQSDAQKAQLAEQQHLGDTQAAAGVKTSLAAVRGQTALGQIASKTALGLSSEQDQAALQAQQLASQTSNWQLAQNLDYQKSFDFNQISIANALRLSPQEMVFLSKHGASPYAQGGGFGQSFGQGLGYSTGQAAGQGTTQLVSNIFGALARGIAAVFSYGTSEAIPAAASAAGGSQGLSSYASSWWPSSAGSQPSGGFWG